MEASKFEVKSYPDMWGSLGMDVERFEKMRCVLGGESVAGLTTVGCQDNKLQTHIKV